MKLFFFHYSEYYKDTLIRHNSEKPLFYWVSDRYFNHINIKMPHKYLYLCVQDTENLKYTYRKNFNYGSLKDLKESYLQFKQDRDNNQVGSPNYKYYIEPPFISVYGEIKPSMALEYTSEGNFNITTPQDPISKTNALKLIDDGEGIKFTKIKEIREKMPDLGSAFPFI